MEAEAAPEGMIRDSRTVFESNVHLFASAVQSED
jgi:hypothetical protein